MYKLTFLHSVVCLQFLLIFQYSCNIILFNFTSRFLFSTLYSTYFFVSFGDVLHLRIELTLFVDKHLSIINVYLLCHLGTATWAEVSYDIAISRYSLCSECNFTIIDCVWSLSWRWTAFISSYKYPGELYDRIHAIMMNSDKRVSNHHQYTIYSAYMTQSIQTNLSYSSL